ncbi:MAG: hypothetical protein J6T01_01345 [Kiritimatiellae bacterium]|nr:hypothetical protein [Kiritimatiellia bacterium]
MVRKGMRRTMELLFAAAVCLAGCGNEQSGKIIIQCGSDTKTATGYRDVTCQQQRFATKCLDCYKTGWVDNDGMYIYVGRGDGIPYVLIYRFAGRSADAREFMEGRILPHLKEAYGDRMVDFGEVKEYSFGGKKLPGVLFSYKVNDNSVVKNLRLCMKEGGDIISFNAKHMKGDAYSSAVKNVLDAAVKNFRLTGEPHAAAKTAAPGNQSARRPETAAPQAKTAAKKSGGGKISVTPSEVKRVVYQTYRDPSGYFSMKIPRGWRVKTGLKPDGAIDLISYAITVYDPKKPDRELYFNLNTASGVKSADAHNWYVKAYGAGSPFAKMPVVSPKNTAGFFAAMGPAYGFSQFAVLERLGKTQFGGDAIIAECTSAASGARLQGLFHAVVAEMNYNVSKNPFKLASGNLDVGILTEYVVLSEITPKAEFVDWQPVLDRCLASIVFTEMFHNQRRDAWRRVIGTSNYIMHTANSISDMIMDSYKRRNATYDVLSQKRSDATLGYERVLDTETGEYYRAENGFSDWYDGTRYRPVNDNAAYLSPVSGDINWKR